MMPDVIRNATVFMKRFSTWVVVAATMTAAWWLEQPLETQAAYLAAYPLLAKLGPGLSFAAYFFAKIVPQGIDQPKA